MIEILLALVLAQNPSCKADLKGFFVWAEPGVAAVQSQSVPQNRVWLVRSAGLHTSYPFPAIWSFELAHLAENGTCCHLTALARSDWRSGTPPLALERQVILYQGEFLSSRMCCGIDNYSMGMSISYYDLPSQCLGFIKNPL